MREGDFPIKALRKELRIFKSLSFSLKFLWMTLRNNKREESVPAKLAEVWDNGVICCACSLACNGNWEEFVMTIGEFDDSSLSFKRGWDGGVSWGKVSLIQRMSRQRHVGHLHFWRSHVHGSS